MDLPADGRTVNIQLMVRDFVVAIPTSGRHRRLGLAQEGAVRSHCVHLETGRLVERLPEERADVLAQWLGRHPGVEVVSILPSS